MAMYIHKNNNNRFSAYDNWCNNYSKFNFYRNFIYTKFLISNFGSVRQLKYSMKLIKNKIK